MLVDLLDTRDKNGNTLLRSAALKGPACSGVVALLVRRVLFEIHLGDGGAVGESGLDANSRSSRVNQVR